MENKQEIFEESKDAESPDNQMESISLEDSEVEPTSSPVSESVFAGDLVCFRADKPYEWTNWYGKALSPQDPLVKALKIISDGPKSEENDATEPSESDCDTPNEPLKEPIFVQWISTNRIGKVNKNEIGVVDRNFIPGQRVLNDAGVRGTVWSTSAKVALSVINSSYVVENIPVQSLHPISTLVRGREILYRGWIGVITRVTRSITSKLDSGPIFNVLSTESDGFMRTDPYWGPFLPCPGNRTAVSYPVLQKAKFQSGFINFLNRWFPPARAFYNSTPCTTTAVQALSIEVKWIQKCPSTLFPNAPEEGPERLIPKSKFGDIKLLGIPSSETIGMNSIRMYSIKPSDKILGFSTWFSSFQSRILGSNAPDYVKLNYDPSQQVSIAFHTGYETPGRVLARETFAEVQFDDGSIEEVKCTNLVEVVSNEEPEAIPVGLVVERIHGENEQEYGIIQPSENLLSHKLVNVRWILPTENGTQDIGIQRESLFNVKPHSKFSLFQKGTIVYILDDVKQNRGIGTVADLDVCHGKLILAVPDIQSTISEWPHLVVPITTKCFWDFFTRKWIVEQMLPPMHQIEIENGLSNSSNEAIPITLRGNNNNIVSGVPSGTIWDEPTFEMSEIVPGAHQFFSFNLKTPIDTQALREEMIKIKENLPEGIWVRGYDSRMDLYSAVILGPEKTPYEDGLFFFDIQLPLGFPSVPPKIHHIAYTSETISPFIAADGTFCVAKLNWDFNGETGKPGSYIAYALGQIQELVFVAEPFFQIFGKESMLGTKDGEKGSRTLNEQIYLSILSSFYNMAKRPYDIWRRVINQHLSANLQLKVAELTRMLEFLQDVTDGKTSSNDESVPIPSVLIPPISEGFKVGLTARLKKLGQLVLSDEEIVCDEETNEVADIANNDVVAEKVDLGSTLETEGEGSCAAINQLNDNENTNQQF